MRTVTTTKLLRLVFLTVAFVAYWRVSFADPYWFQDCNSYCTGEIRVHECNFYDFNFSSTCQEAEDHYQSWCDSAAYGEYPWFVMGYCFDWGGGATGSFYCSYSDPNTCSPQ